MDSTHELLNRLLTDTHTIVNKYVITTNENMDYIKKLIKANNETRQTK